MLAFWQLLSNKFLIGSLCALLFAPMAQAASIFAVASGGAAIDGGTLLVLEGSTTTIDVYLDAGDPDNFGFTVDLYSTANGSVLSNPVTTTSLGAVQSYGYRWNSSSCEPDCGQLVLVGTIDVTVGVAGTGLDSDGSVLIGDFSTQYPPLTTLIQAIPEPTTALLLALGLAGLTAAGRKPNS